MQGKVTLEDHFAIEATLDTPDLSSLNCSTVRPLRWLWQDKIPLGKLHRPKLRRKLGF